MRAIAYRVDPASVLNRCRGAEADRRLSVRPAPDAMAYLTAFLPVAQAVAAHAAMAKAAASARADGDGRTKGQVMADTLVDPGDRAGDATAVPVEIQLVVTDRTLLARETPHRRTSRATARYRPAGPVTSWPEVSGGQR